jgi:DNA-binding transcriptional LysR family regulator
MTFVQTPALALLPGLMERLAETAPELQVEVVHCETAPALDDLRSQAVDLVVGIEYDPVPVPRQRDVDRRDLMREDVLLALHPQHQAATKRGPIGLAACEEAAWASGHRGTGLDAVVRNVCNRLGGYEPQIRHRSDDGLVLSALVASGRAVALLPALLATGMPQIIVRRLREERLQRTIFTAVRVTATDALAIEAARDALLDTARQVAAQQRNLEVLP